MALTPKQERFAQLVAEGKTQADAYRGAFDTKPTTKPETIIANASRLMADSNISAMVDELRKPIIEAVGITLESHLKDLMTLRNLAVKNNQINAAITAEIARGKAAGVSTDRVEATIKTASIKKFEFIEDDGLDDDDDED
jgi:phage terminase small subunit